VLETTRVDADDDATLVARALACERASHALTRLTTGPVRVRVAWADGAKRRKETWRVAEILRDAESAVVSDSRDAPWEAIAFVEPRGLRLELYPALEDDRFAYRVADVPAASHPTIAAALARVAGVVADDVVWDPFVGSGLELCERARLGPYAKLIGTDIDERALERARANLESAGVARHALIHADARRAETGPISLVVTNPPMGRRVSRGADLGALLSDVITRASTKLGPKGRIVILSPTPGETARAARNAGLVSSVAMRVDLGGFVAELQRWDIPADAGVRSRSEPGNAARRTSPSQRGPARGSRR
jgi:predicted RNA methylase